MPTLEQSRNVSDSEQKKRSESHIEVRIFFIGGEIHREFFQIQFDLQLSMLEIF